MNSKVVCSFAEIKVGVKLNIEEPLLSSSPVHGVSERDQRD